MEKGSPVFDFDMGRKEYIKKMKNYLETSEDDDIEGTIDAALKSDKNYFYVYYGIDLDKYLHKGRKFIVPYEMADLFCLMIAVMKSSPTYDQRKKDISLKDFVDHNKDVIRFVGNLPPELTDYVMDTPEYESANILLNCLPIVAERMAALLHITLQRGDPNGIEQLVDDLDELYERYFWNVDLDDIFEADFAKPFRPAIPTEKSDAQRLVDNILSDVSMFLGDSVESIDFEKLTGMLDEKYDKDLQDIKKEDILAALEDRSRWTVAAETPNFYHIFDTMLGNLFRALDRENWPDGTEAKVIVLLEQWKEKYKDDKDRDDKIKSEYLHWLRSNDWHILNGAAGVVYDGLEERIEEYNDRYNKKALIHPRFLRDESGGNEREAEIATDRMEYEFSQIRLALQNQLDIYILDKLSEQLFLKNPSKFTEQLHQPEFKHLSRPIFLFIVELLKNSSTEQLIGLRNSRPAKDIYDLLRNNSDEEIFGLLSTYITSTKELLDDFDNMYVKHGLMKYVVAIIKGEKDIDGCCEEIYERVFVENQLQKCDHFTENKNEYQKLKDSIMSSAGNMYADIIKKGKPTAQATKVTFNLFGL